MGSREQEGAKGKRGRGKALHLGKIPCQLLKPGSPGILCPLGSARHGDEPLSPQDLGELQGTGGSEIMFRELPKERRFSGRLLRADGRAAVSSRSPRQQKHAGPNLSSLQPLPTY